jgi:hypothetical protein
VIPASDFRTAPSMEKLAAALWWRFHLMRQFVAIFSSHGVPDSHLMGTRPLRSL